MTTLPEVSENKQDKDFVVILEGGIRDVLKNRKTKPSEKVAAIVAGTKLMLVKHKIDGGDDKGFFS